MSKKIQWIEVCKLPKNTMRGKDPISKLQSFIHSKLPDVVSISDVGVTELTNEYLRKQLLNAVDKEGIWSSHYKEKVVAFSMLNFSPADVAGGKDFVLYVRR